MQPIAEQLQAVSEQLAAALSGTKPKRRRGQPPKKAGRRRGRPPKKTAVRAKRGGKAKRAERGALPKAVNSVLSQAKSPLKLVDIRNRVMKKSAFSRHDPKGLYTQITAYLGKSSEIKKTTQGYVKSKAAQAKKKTAKKKAARKKKAIKKKATKKRATAKEAAPKAD